jgi:Protein of unknown function (DUF1553)/Protein of unknown function (DUF1549)/Planctomycete cytochrome C
MLDTTMRSFLLPCIVFGIVTVNASAAAPISFNRDIRPILADKCYACHGPDKNQRKANLHFDTEEAARADLGGRRAIVPGKVDESELVRRITAQDKTHMPPEKFGKKLSREQIDLLTRWIEEGAKWEKHWSLIAPQRQELPVAFDVKWNKNPIDHFIHDRLRREDLLTVLLLEADDRTLIRRLSFDLTGLPPSPEAVDIFFADKSPQAYEKLVDRLLASPHFGERLALYWLDQVRYADTGGYHSDNHRDISLYRDYVIDAFNKNKPFDQFTIEQLAGDLLPSATLETRIASGYNRLLMTTEEGGAQAKEYQAKYAADRVRNVSTVWLGTTLGCCECHDHKFDPFATKEFYRFAAFFADVKEKAVGRQDQDKLPSDEQAAQLKKLNEQIAEVQKQTQTDETKKKLAELQKKKADLEKMIPATLLTTAVSPRVMRVLPRGNWLDDSGEIVTPGVPASLPPLKLQGEQATRLDLAKWLVAADQPLVARVFVNRLWKLMFGQGLVKTLDDFGSQGAWPTHPELLDWLAVEFRESGWDVKHLLKLIVMSRTYRQSAEMDEKLKQRDPYNYLLARQNRFRLDAEMVRDNALAVSGLLVRKVGGASVKPYQPAGYWAMLNFPKREWQNDAGEGLYRRGLYTYWCRTFPHPSLIAFDAPSREECTVERPRSNTPLQALVLLNDPIYVEASRIFAERILKGADTTEKRIAFAYRQALNRQPLPEEIEVLAAMIEKHWKQYQADKAAATALLSVGDRAAATDLDPAELAAWTSAARVLLNLHETITRN